jgi:hypothetical protein
MLGYIAAPQCGESFTFRISPKTGNAEVMRYLDSITISCYVSSNPHEIHHGRADIADLGKTIFVSWGKGKPRIIETTVAPVASFTPAITKPPFTSGRYE